MDGQFLDSRKGYYLTISILGYFLISHKLNFSETQHYLFQAIISAILVSFVYTGHNWARVLLAVLLGIHAVIDLYSALSVSSKILPGLLSLFSAASLLLSKNVIMFLEWNRSIANRKSDTPTSTIILITPILFWIAAAGVAYFIYLVTCGVL